MALCHRYQAVWLMVKAWNRQASSKLPGLYSWIQGAVIVKNLEPCLIHPTQHQPSQTVLILLSSSYFHHQDYYWHHSLDFITITIIIAFIMRDHLPIILSFDLNLAEKQ